MISWQIPSEELTLLQKGDKSPIHLTSVTLSLLFLSVAWVKAVLSVCPHRLWFIYLWWLLMFSSGLFIFRPVCHEKWHREQDTMFQLKLDQYCLNVLFWIPKFLERFHCWVIGSHQVLYWREFTSAENLAKASASECVTLFPLLMGGKSHKNNRSCTIFTS